MADMQNQIEGPLADSIAMLEQILEVMPQDEEALKALYGAYCQANLRDRAFEYLNRLVDLAENEGGAVVTDFVGVELPTFEEEYPLEVAAQLARLRLQDLSDKLASGGPGGRSTDTRSAGDDVGDEMGLAWQLYEEKQLSQDEYSSVLHDLTEISSKELDVPSSVLHVLHDRNFPQMNRILNHMSARSGVPCISLASFELDDRLGGVLPLGIPIHDGALPFAFFGDDLLVGVLNPFNEKLVSKVETTSGHRCHSFLVKPDDYDAALERFRSLVA